MTKILLTGASGFVGRHVTKELCASGAKVTAVLRDKHNVPTGIEAAIFVEDLFAANEDYWCEVCSDFDSVVHLAWYAEPGQYLTSDRNLHCLSGSLALARGAVRAGIKKFTGVGTCFEYALDSPELRLNVPISVDSPLGPTTLYGAAKASTWLTLSEYMKVNHVAFAWCRLFYLYGEGENERRLVPFLRAKLEAGEPADLTSGRQVRDYLDVAQAGVLIAKAALEPYEGALNICSGKPVTIIEFATEIANEYGKAHLLRFGSREDNLSDPPYVVGIPSIQ